MSTEFFEQNERGYSESRIIRSLSDLCSDCFTLILQLRKNHDLGDPSELRHKILTVFRKMSDEGRQIGVRTEELQEAQYALSAFLDETIMASEWHHKETWSRQSLTVELFQDPNAGDVFFNRLEQIRSKGKTKVQVLEVHYLCLTLGFEGKYGALSHEELQGLIYKLSQEIKQHTKKSYDELSPNWKRSDDMVDAVKEGPPLWLIITGLIGIAAIVLLVYKINLGNHIMKLAEILKELI